MSYAYPDAGSSIDNEVQFSNASDMVLYAPRATQVALLSPFPTHWVEDVSTTTSKLFRRVAAFEMTVLYLTFIGLAGWLFVALRGQGDGLTGDRRLAAVCLLVFSLVWTVTYVLAVVNLGSIYRVRMPAMLLWLSLGVIGWSIVLKRCRA